MGYYFLFEVNKMLVKKEMKAMIKQNHRKVTIIKIPDAETNPDLFRVEKQEIVFKGNLYDIVKEMKKGRITTFYCIFDFKEQNLIAGFKKVCHNKFSQTLLDHLIKIALPVYRENPVLTNSSPMIFYTKNIVPIPSFQIPPTPPPELF